LTQPTEACGLTLPIMKRARDARLLGVVAAALLVAGCGISSRPSQTTGQTTTQLKTSTPAVTHSTVTNHPTATAVAPAAAASPCGRGGRPLYRHVIWIWMENHNYNRPRLRRPCAHRSASDQFTSPWRHHRDMTDFPLPGDAQASVVFPAPAPGSGNWVGAPSAAFDDDGSLVLAYRVRTAVQRGSSIVLARSHDGESFTTEVSIEKDRFGAESLERPGIVRTDGRCDLLVSLPFVRRASHQALAHRSARGANGQPTAHR
jgi:hypothetical protein